MVLSDLHEISNLFLVRVVSNFDACIVPPPLEHTWQVAKGDNNYSQLQEFSELFILLLRGSQHKSDLQPDDSTLNEQPALPMPTMILIQRVLYLPAPVFTRYRDLSYM